MRMRATAGAPPMISITRSAGVLMGATNGIIATRTQQDIANIAQHSQCEKRNHFWMDENIQWIRERLKKLKAQGSGKNQAGLARALNIDTGAVSRMLKGERKLRLDEVEKVKRYLGESDAELPLPTFVREVDASASAGPGSIVHYEDRLSQWGFPEPWVRAELRATPKDLEIIMIEGDSGVSTPPRHDDILPGDRVIVNRASRAPSPPGYFVLWDGMGLVAKRVEYVPGSEPPTLRIKSNNERYSPYDVTLDEANIVGRIVGRWQRL